MPPASFVLTLLLHELRGSLRAVRRRDLVWVFGGGGLLAAYAFGIVVNGVLFRAGTLREAGWLWFAAVPTAVAGSGAMTGWTLAGLAETRANAPFLRALPLGAPARRRAAAFAARVLGAPATLLDGGLVLLLALLVGRPAPVAWWLGATALSAVAFAIALRLRLAAGTGPSPSLPLVGRVPPEGRGVGGRRGNASEAQTPLRATPLIAVLDRRRPAWLGSWAWSLPAGRLRLTVRATLTAALLALLALGAIVASFVRTAASAGVVTGVVGGFILFVLTIRCHPLRSPVLRASALRFSRALGGLLRLPLALSAGFFVLTALPATAAEPSAWQAPVAGGIGLLVLDAIYAVFAAFFARSPRLAALAFTAALGLTAYESLEYGRPILLALGALVIFLALRTRKTYRHG